MKDNNDNNRVSIEAPNQSGTSAIHFDCSDTTGINYYKESRDRYLETKLFGYPRIDSFTLSISLNISPSTKNGPVIYAILDTLPDDTFIVDNSNIRITLKDVQIGEYLQAAADILAIAKSWKSTITLANGSEIDYTGFFYFVDYYHEKFSGPRVQRQTPTELKKKYISKKASRRKKKEKPTRNVALSRNNPQQSLEAVLDTYIDLFGNNKDVQIKDIPTGGKVLILENNLIVCFWLLPRYWATLDSPDHKDWDFPYIMIQELTHNDFFKFNFAGFKRSFSYDYIGIDFYAFHGIHYYVKEVDRFDYVNKHLPELQLMQRYEQYPGENHHFIILKIEDVNGKTHYGIGETKQAVYTFILKLCKELEEKNSKSLELNSASCLSSMYRENKKFIEAFLSWKGKPKKWRLENVFSYTYEDIMVKDDSELFSIPDQIIKKAYNGAYDQYEYGSYSKPVNRWKSEELVYNITKKLYKDYQVIYQYSPYYLSTEGGCMSYDIYICGLKVAIEYQGKQHFEPVDYFGGKENFESQQKRDKLKAKKSLENGVKLIYINYWDDITPKLVKERIESAMSED